MTLRHPHLLVSLTAHGFGHAAMTAPVVNELRHRLPSLRVTLQSDHPAAWLATRFEAPYDLISGPGDFGLKMASATKILLEESAAGYRAQHDTLETRVKTLVESYRSLEVDLLLANIPYVALLAAKQAGIPTIAMSCLNWADIYGYYFGGRPEGPAIEAEMLDAYRSASVFLRPAPSMPMPRLTNTRSIGPIAPRGRGCRAEIRARLGLAESGRLGIIAFGGVDPGLPLDRWPHLDGWRWLVTGDTAGHPDLIAFDPAWMDFTDVLQSCDVVVTKPGYGTFTEAAVNGVPVLYLPRVDWPESPALVDWLTNVGRCLPIAPEALFDAPSLGIQLQLLFSNPIKPLVSPTGSVEAAETVLSMLAGLGRLRK
ncbi:hypothetical protein [Telmatospirillum sp.]|uniref:hypothetical protein n=1 Tax=Telmatospirillum sp. TaxID=2079197 RepID=UPI002844AB05|nr:hypothetical protein [Telmatospirillum sp.]MDR3439453.1 hypothetical protein [Telmatospirillum sp.]